MARVIDSHKQKVVIQLWQVQIFMEPGDLYVLLSMLMTTVTVNGHF